MTTLGLDRLPDRCAHGFAAVQHPSLCACSTGPASEWSVFVAALRSAARDGFVRQEDVRPLIQSIPHKHRGQLYKRARRDGLLVEVEQKRSKDFDGKNAGRWEPVYRLTSPSPVSPPPTG